MGLLDLFSRESDNRMRLLIFLLSLVYALWSWRRYARSWGVPVERRSDQINESARTPARRLDFPDLKRKRQRSFVFESGTSARVRVEVMEHASGRPLGTVVWDGAIVLCQYLLDCGAFPGDHWRSKRVLELGGGTGIVGVSLALRGQSVLLCV